MNSCKSPKILNYINRYLNIGFAAVQMVGTDISAVQCLRPTALKLGVTLNGDSISAGSTTA